jgi:hypothetical protein
MGLNFDLAAVAAMAGLGGSTIAATAGFLIFKGLIMRILAQIVVTAVLSFLGFIALFNWLGFTIVPKASVPAPSGAENFSVQSTPAEPAVSYEIRSPWSK